MLKRMVLQGSGSGRLGSGDRELLRTLNADWLQVAGLHCEVIESWAEQEPRLSGCLDGAEVLARISLHPDRILGFLLAVDHRRDAPESSGRESADRDGSALAGRIVLQAMLGKMVRMAHCDPGAGVDDYITQLWCRIRRYPLARRPRRIAANLALDTLKAVQAEQGRRRSTEPRSADPRPDLMLEDDIPAAPTELSAIRVLGAANELGLIDRQTHQILAAVYADGWTGKEVAEQLQISHAMVRFRCSKAVRALAREATTLAAVAC